MNRPTLPIQGGRGGSVGRRSAPGLSKVDQAYFIPSFSIRRPVLASPEVRDSLEQLTDRFRRKPYTVTPLGDLAMTLLEKRQLIVPLQRAEAEPEPAEVSQLVFQIARGLGELTKGLPRRMNMPVGSAHRFGDRSGVIGVIPLGWRGYDRAYAKRDSDDRRALNYSLVNEMNLIIGGVVNALSGAYRADGQPAEIDFGQLGRTTPHLSILRKNSGKAISDNEAVELGGEVIDALPACVEIFDPVIHARLFTKSTTGVTAGTNQTLGNGITYVRRPKRGEFLWGEAIKL